MERTIWEDGNEGASNPVSVSRTRMERRIRGGDSASARNRGESSGGTGEEGGEKMIRWERFLPRRCLRVLLVECDDSTRHIVAALLRKCSYQVAAVADGLKAWEFLKEKHYNVDLVLTEVATPSLSGIGLLSKIVNNDICKHIPVITRKLPVNGIWCEAIGVILSHLSYSYQVMSSHDSIGIVFKCMLKGAVDFLVKPVRKNELRNLWQHVWRKYCSSRCGNGYINENPDQEKYEAMSNNNADSNHASANAGDKSRMRNSYEKESDTQSSCSKPEAVNESEQPRQEPVQTENRSFSREIESKLDKYDADVAQMAPTPSMQEDEEAKDKLMGLEIKVTLIQAAASTEKIQEENGFNDRISCREDQGSLRSKEDFNIHPDPSNQSNVPNEPSRQIIDFIGTIATGQCSYTVLGDNGCREDVLCEATEFSSVKESVSNFGSSPLWELSLRRPQINSLGDHAFQERHVLRHSDASAFSRYGKTRSHSCPKSGSSPASLCIRTKECSVNCHPQAGSNDIGAAGKNVPFFDKEKNGSGGEALMYCKPLSGSNNEDVDPFISSHSKEDACVGQSSTEKFLSHSQLGAFPLPIPVDSIPFQSFCTGYGAILQPIFYPNPSMPVHGSAAVQKVKEAFPYDQSGHTGIHLSNNLQYINCQQSDQNCVPHQSKQGMVNHRVDMETMDAIVVLQVTEEVDQTAGCSKSIHKGSGSNGSNEDTNAVMIAGAALESGNEDGFQSCSGQGSDRDHARREAALIKFRLKRKDRCFEKKVRYHSRKKLAEQRPRLKGQFVRQAVVDGSTTATETDD
ncbi:two-component response regulator-like APRR3 isoform X1 [Magnolia sinica]|uniref:two-component response regulator-like APRR3 isoform X1 n=1 Tax=Magnolia sinica TaxID=86752 RepID=UPI002658B652|nr:two-component response regulator-like APRR3 isoform X1 [Magnolia sinica]